MATNNSKDVTIIVNGSEHQWLEKEITYQQVVNLAYSNNPPTGENITFNVAYLKGRSDQEGFIGPNSKPLHVRDGMEFRVKHSTRS